METDQYIFFFGSTKTKYKVFSQWYPCTFVDELGLEYANCEQYMMVNKAMLFNDPDSVVKIMAITNPKSIKMLGRKIVGFDPDIWNDNKFDIVIEGNRLKFTQNPELMKILLSTGDKTIVEASPYDKIWGIGLSAEKACKIPEKKWPGQNLLGKALEIVRSENI